MENTFSLQANVVTISLQHKEALVEGSQLISQGDERDISREENEQINKGER